MTPDGRDLAIAAAPSQAYFGGSLPLLGTPNSVLLYWERSVVSPTLSFIVAATLPRRSWSCSTAVSPSDSVAPREPSMPGMFRVHFLLPSSSLQATASPCP